MTKQNHPLTSELTITAPNGDKANISNLPAPVMQALYNQITGRREKITNTFRKDYIIKSQNIRNLVEKIEQTLVQFNYHSTSTNITIFHYKRDKCQYSSFEKFLQYDDGRNDKISSIALEFDFLISVPQVGEYQNYKIVITLNSYVNTTNDKKANYGISVYRGDEPVTYSIEYVDYVVARTFKQTIEEWVDELPEQEILKISEFVGRNQENIQKVLGTITAFSLVLLALDIVPLTGETAVRDAVLIVGALIVLKEAFERVYEECIDTIGARGVFPFLLVNKGDDRNFAAFIKKRKKSKNIYSFIFVVCLIPIAVNLLSTLITKGW